MSLGDAKTVNGSENKKSEIYSEGRIALTMGSGCDSVGVEVASNTIGSRFESGHQLMNKFIVNS